MASAIGPGRMRVWRDGMDIKAIPNEQGLYRFVDKAITKSMSALMPIHALHQEGRLRSVFFASAGGG